MREILQAAYAGSVPLAAPEVAHAFEELLAGLEAGAVRAAQPVEGGWETQAWVKEGILVGFRLGKLVDLSPDACFRFFDKDTYPPQALTLAHRVRVVPGGTTVRRGAHLDPGVILMPPAYVNVGAYVGADTMVDSHALVGSCAQVGRNVHLSAAAQVGGVIEPPGARPVILEDEVLVGGNCGVYEGTWVRRRAVLGAGVVLTASTPVYDIPNQRILRPAVGGGLEIPESAVVVAGSRRIAGDFAAEHGLSLYAPVIVKYRDARTDARTALESALR
jgi:2,3,4,5-tetrahydropyridine-2-carboxylate N-succinyltransferase